MYENIKSYIKTSINKIVLRLYSTIPTNKYYKDK